MTFFIDIYTALVELGLSTTLALGLGGVVLFFVLRELWRWYKVQSKALQTITEIGDAMTLEDSQRLLRSDNLQQDLERIKDKLEYLCVKIDTNCKECHLDQDMKELHEDNRETNQILRETDNDVKDISKEIQRACLELLSLSRILVEDARR